MSNTLKALQVRKAYEDMRKRRLDDFMAGFNVISLKLKEMYQMITLGGDAELELVDSLDPFSEVRYFLPKSVLSLLRSGHCHCIPLSDLSTHGKTLSRSYKI